MSNSDVRVLPTHGASFSACTHCGLPVLSTSWGEFCCSGCRAAYNVLRDFGLGAYYDRRRVDPEQRPLRPDVSDADITDYAPWTCVHDDGTCTLHLMVEGLHCAACVWVIESLLGRQSSVMSARLNMTTHRLVVRWKGSADAIRHLLIPVFQVGYHLVPYNPEHLRSRHEQAEQELLRCIAIAGFATANVMLLSVSVWAGIDMGPGTRDFFHWLSALFVFPATAWCLQPFMRSALSALQRGQTNMDVPITIGVLLTLCVSMWETINSRPHAYFDAAITLLFFLLIGRYLDLRARGRARAAAEHLLVLGHRPLTIEHPDGSRAVSLPAHVKPGMIVLVAAGDRIGVDGVVDTGTSEVDTSLLTGETLPKPVVPGTSVFAGTLNVGAPLRVRTTSAGEGTVLAEMSRLVAVAEQSEGRYVHLADRLARIYAPVVHVMALATFVGWSVLTDVSWQDAMMIAVSVLVITCPCALALAVPVVQVIASGVLLRRGILLKSATALERLVSVDTIVFDKTGTLTVGTPVLVKTESHDGLVDDEALSVAASLAAVSRHPLARALVREKMVPAAEGVEEKPGSGLLLRTSEGEIRLGRSAFCGVGLGYPSHDGLELWLSRPRHMPVRFMFSDDIRCDAISVIQTLKAQGLNVSVVSGDRPGSVKAVAQQVGLDVWDAMCSPVQKVQYLDSLRLRGRRVLMVGDGLNDAPALASSDVSMSPTSAADISQTVADIVFQGARLSPVSDVFDIACIAHKLVRQNLAFTLLYNVLTVPLAVAGYVTPLFAALAMSTSSIVVTLNAFRLMLRKRVTV